MIINQNASQTFGLSLVLWWHPTSQGAPVIGATELPHPSIASLSMWRNRSTELRNRALPLRGRSTEWRAR